MTEFSQIYLNGRLAWAIDHSEFTILKPEFDGNIVWSNTAESNEFKRVGHGMIRLKYCLRDEIKEWMDENSVEYILAHDTMPDALLVFDDNAAMMFKLTWSGV
jgi:hypothetical protein